MKKLFLSLVAMFFAITTFGQGIGSTFIIDGIQYTITSVSPSEVEVAYYSGPAPADGVLEIPETATHPNNGVAYSVTKIGSSAFNNNASDALTSVIIPNSVKTIGNMAFWYCNALTSIVIGSGIETIGSTAFYGSSNLSEVTCLATTAPAVNLNNYGTFYGTATEKTLKIPSESTGYEDWADVFTEIVPAGRVQISFIANGIQYGITSLVPAEVEVLMLTENPASTSLTFPETVEYNGTSYSVTEISSSFAPTSGAKADGLTHIIIPNSVKTIGVQAFWYCNALTSVVIGSGIETIGSTAFYGSSNLSEVTCLATTAPAVNLNNYGTFYGTATEKTLKIPIGASGYDTWSNSFTEIVPAGEVQIIFNGIEYGVLSLYPAEVKVIGYTGAVETLNIPNTISYQNVEFTVKEIADNVFNGCESLISVNIPQSVERIGKAAFKKCVNLEEVNFAPNSQLKIIDDDAFLGEATGGFDENCKLVVYSNKITTIDIPASVERIGKRAFRYCKELEEVNFSEQSQLKVIDERAFSGGGGSANGCADTVSNKIRTFNFPASVETVGDYVFGYATNLETVNIPTNSQLDTISGQMFYMCTRLSSPIYIPSGVTGIGNKAFYHCFSLPTVIFAEDSQLEKTGAYAFYYCTHMTEITLPASLKDLGYYAFTGCDRLSSVEFRENSLLEKIGDWSFRSCDSLRLIKIPANVTNIGRRVFGDCANLKVVMFLGNVPPTITCNSNDRTDYCFAGTPDTKIMLVPYGSLSNYIGLPSNIGATFAGVYETISSVTSGSFEDDATWGNINIAEIPNIPYHIKPEHTITLNSELVLDENSTLINDGVLRIAQGGELINETDVNVGGIVEVETPLLAEDAWHFVAAPFNGYKLAAVKPATTDISVLEFDYTAGTWSNDWARINTEVGAGEGFFAWSFTSEPTVFTTKPNPEEDDATYSLNNGDVTVTKTLVNDAVEGHWMALANPYTFKLDVAEFINDNSPIGIQGGIVYKYNGESFDAVPEGEINVTEGFFVNFASEGEKSASFTKSQRYDASAKSSAGREFVRLEMLDGERSVELLFAHNESAEQGYDIFDANKLFSPIGIAEPYFVTEGIALVKEEVKELPYYATMNVKSNESKEVKFRADYIPEGLAVSIIDGEEVIDMTEGVEYATEISSGENADRFKVLIKKNVGLADVEELNASIVNNNRHISISAQEDVNISVYNTLGQKVFETEESNFVLNTVPAGAYVVKVQGSKSVKSQKIIVE